MGVGSQLFDIGDHPAGQRSEGVLEQLGRQSADLGPLLQQLLQAVARQILRKVDDLFDGLGR